MKSSTLAAAVVVIIAIVGLGWWWYAKAPSSTTPVDTQTQATTTEQGTSTASGTGTGVTVGVELGNTQSYSAATVATHNNKASCWTIIDSNVYDLTKWIPQHPGGQAAILSLCGHDGSAAFHGQHDDAKKQADILATFKIGVLAQ